MCSFVSYAVCWRYIVIVRYVIVYLLCFSFVFIFILNIVISSLCMWRTNEWNLVNLISPNDLMILVFNRCLCSFNCQIKSLDIFTLDLHIVTIAIGLWWNAGAPSCSPSELCELILYQPCYPYATFQCLV